MARLCMWGHSMGLRIPKYVAECAALKVGDEMYVRVLDSGDILVRAAKPRAIPAGYKVADGNESEDPFRELTDAEVLAQW
jgi:antitoxin MazE